MAGVNYTSEFLGFHDEDFEAEDVTASEERLTSSCDVLHFDIIVLDLSR